MKQLRHSTWLSVWVLVSLVALAGCNAVELPRSLAAYARPSTLVGQAANLLAAPTPQPTPTSPPTGPLTSDDLLAALQGRLQAIYGRVSPSVVNIQVTKSATAGLSIPGLPFGQSTPQQPPVQSGLGSGFVWDHNGHIVTNNHVVADADKITVVFSDGTSARAEIVGTDPDSDLAVLKVDVPADALQPVTMADSTAVQVGQLAVAIGNPFGLEGTMTVGFVSALGRSLPVEEIVGQDVSYTIPDIIQTDAPINPGNSGGVLVDDQGRVVGVTSAIESPVRANAGIGFAIPSVIASKVVPALIENGRYEHSWLGLSGMTLNADLNEAAKLAADQRGVLVAEVTAGSPADKAGLRGSDRQAEIEGQPVSVGGDVIVAIDGQPVREFEDLVTYLARHTTVGQTVTLDVQRDGKTESLRVTLAARPKAEAQQREPDRLTAGGAWLGIQGMTLNAEIAKAMDLPASQKGALVVQVVQGSPADEAGLRGSSITLDVQGQRVLVGGDVITAIDGQPVDAMEDVSAFTRQAKVGQEATLTVLREGKETKVAITLGQNPNR